MANDYATKRSEDDIRQDYMCRTATQCGRCYCGKIAVPNTNPAAPVKPRTQQGGSEGDE